MGCFFCIPTANIQKKQSRTDLNKLKKLIFHTQKQEIKIAPKAHYYKVQNNAHVSL